MNPKLLCTLQSCLGIVFTALCAVVVAEVFSRTHWKLTAPFVFAVMLVMLASRFGAPISVAGSVLGAMIFALLLFPPLYSLHVDNGTQRASLAWMILLSVSLSYLLYPSRGGGDGSVSRIDSGKASESVGEPEVLRSPSQKFVGTGEMAEVRSQRQGES